MPMFCVNHCEVMLGVWRVLTSCSFSGLPHRPPLGVCLSLSLRYSQNEQLQAELPGSAQSETDMLLCPQCMYGM